MIRAVIDTNVFLSALFWGGIPLKVIKLAFSGKITGITSLAIINELEEKLLKKFEYPKDQTSQYLEIILAVFLVVKPKQKVNVVEDPKDNKIIEAAIEANAQYIITGDKHLLKIKKYQNIKIVTPREFLETL